MIVKRGFNNTNDDMVRKFLRMTKNSNLIEECKEREYFTKPSELERRKESNRKRVLDGLKDPEEQK